MPLIFVGKARVLPEVIKNETKQLLEPLRSNNNRLAEGMEGDVGDLILWPAESQANLQATCMGTTDLAGLDLLDAR